MTGDGLIHFVARNPGGGAVAQPAERDDPDLRKKTKTYTDATS